MRTYAYSGGNLMVIAAEVYGDPTQWWRLAQQNGLDDFLLVGTGTLQVPEAADDLAGLGLPPTD